MAKKKAAKRVDGDNKEVVDKSGLLMALVATCNKSLGVEGKVTLGTQVRVHERIPTGILALDTITGGGLVPRHLMELYGEESAGKTLLAILIVASMQARGLTVAWVVGEEFDTEWAARNGVNMDKLVLIESLTGDTALETAATLIESGLVDVMVFDSYQSLGTLREMEGGVGAESFGGGGAPQMWGRLYRRTRGAFNSGKAKTSLIGISQVRAPIGSTGSGHMKPSPKPTRIHVLRHWKAVAIECKKGEMDYIDAKTERRRIVGREFHLRCTKNKTSTPERISSYKFGFASSNFGIDRIDEAVRMGKIYGVLESRGAWVYGYDLKGFGEEAYKTELSEACQKEPKLLEKIVADIVAASQE